MVSSFQLLQAASELSGVPVKVIKGRSRARRPVLVRKVLMVVMCDDLWYGRGADRLVTVINSKGGRNAETV